MKDAAQSIVCASTSRDPKGKPTAVVSSMDAKRHATLTESSRSNSTLDCDAALTEILNDTDTVGECKRLADTRASQSTALRASTCLLSGVKMWRGAGKLVIKLWIFVVIGGCSWNVLYGLRSGLGLETVSALIHYRHWIVQCACNMT